MSKKDSGKDTEAEDVKKESSEESSVDNKKPEEAVEAEAQKAENESAEKEISENKELLVVENPEEDEESEAKESKGSSSYKAVAIILLVLLLLTGVGVFATRMSIDKNAVEARLNAWVSAVAGKVGGSADSISFTHGGVKIAGGLFSKKVIIAAPNFVVKNAQYGDVTISTRAIEIYPESSDLTKVRLEIPLALDVVGAGRAYRVVTKSPMALDVEHPAEAQNIAYRMDLPRDLKILSVVDGADGEVKMSFGAASGEAKGFIDVESGEVTLNVSGADVTSSAKRGQISADTLTYNIDSVNEDAAQVKAYDVNAKGVLLSSPYNIFGKLDVELRAERESAALNDGAEVAETHYNIESLLINNGRTEVALEGELQSVSGELVPLGEATLKVKELDVLLAMLRSASLLNDKTSYVAHKVISDVGQVAEDGQVAVSFNRKEGGSFLLGGTTFEEIVALGIKEYFSAKAEEVSALVESGDASAEAVSENAAEEGAVDAPVEGEAAPAVDSTASETPAEVTPALDKKVEETVEEKLEKSGVHLKGDAKEEGAVQSPAEPEAKTVELKSEAKAVADENAVAEKVEESLKSEAPAEPAVKTVKEAAVEAVPAEEISVKSSEAPVQPASSPKGSDAGLPWASPKAAEVKTAVEDVKEAVKASVPAAKDAAVAVQPELNVPTAE